MINVKWGSVLLSWGCLFYILSALYGCTTTAPESDKDVKSSPEVVQSNGQILRDKESLKNSIFTELSHDSAPLKSWENSEGWIAFFGGDLAKALKHFEREDQSDSIKIGRSRTHLELSETYASLDQILTHLTKKWLALERARPRATLHQQWYDWISYVHQPTASLKETLKASPEMAPWLELVTAPTGEHAPPKTSRSYRKWLKFNRALALGDLKSASMMYKTLKLRSPAIRIKGEGEIPSLPIYDLRVYQSLQRYHALKALESLQSLTGWATLLRARALLFLLAIKAEF